MPSASPYGYHNYTVSISAPWVQAGLVNVHQTHPPKAVYRYHGLDVDPELVPFPDAYL